MAAGRETIALSFQAELGDLKKQLRTLPGVTKKQAAEMVRELNTGFKQAEKAAAKAAKANRRQFKQMQDSARMAGLAIAGAAVSVVALGQAFADLQNELADASARTGVAVDTLAGLRLAAEGSGLEFRNLEAGLNKLPKSMADAARGTGVAALAFASLGVDVEQASGDLRSSEDVLQDTFNALAAIEDPARKAATAIDIFGQRAGPAFIQSGAIDNLDAFVSLATEFGVDVGPKAAESAAAFQRQMAALKTVSQGTLFDFVDSLGGPGGLNSVIEMSIRSVIVLGGVAEQVFATLRDQVGSITGPLAEVFFELSEGTVAGAMRSLQRNQDEIIRGVTGLNPAVLGYRLVADSIDAAVASTERADVALAKLNATMGSGERARGFGTPESQGATDAAPGAGSTATTDKAIADLERLRTAQRKAADARLSERAKIELAYIRERDVLIAAFDAGIDIDAIDAATTISQAERRIHLADLKARLHGEEMERLREAADTAAQMTRDIVGSTGDAVGALSALAGAAGAAMAEAGSKGARQNARVLFGISKSLALAMIPLKLAEGLMTAAAQPPPLNAIQSAAVLATAAAQGIAVGSAKPPTFDRGGIINAGTGEQVITATLPGEAVLSREAVGRIGEHGVNALNRGGGGGPTVVQMVYRHRIFDEFVADNMAAPTPLGRAVRGDRVTGRRR
tara:strand:+ start:1034 stop:3082 length:2049 start_codon:yes stop_codon:yes gene_type:complete